MKRNLLAGLAFLILAGCLTVAWLGPGPLSWSLRASLSAPDDATTWAHVPARVPGVASCNLSRLLQSEVGQAVRPELEALTAMRGADLSWFEERLDTVVVVHDGDATGFALGRRLALSPILIARFDERWGPIEGQGHRGASDGMLALFPLEPGLLLATESSAAGRAMQLALTDGEQEEPLPLDEFGHALQARLKITPTLRAHARRSADPRLLPVVEALDLVELQLTALDELEALLTLHCRDESSAVATEGLLRQLEFAASASRQAGGLAIALLGEAGRLLGDLPPLEIGREGSIVRVRTAADADGLRPWLRRALDALARPVLP